MTLRDRVLAARERIGEHVRRTPVERSPFLEERSGARVFLKLENLQRTGSFKLRGALNRLLALAPDERARGVVAASSGNHGMAVACGAAEAGISAVVFVPRGASEAKVDVIRSFGAEVRVAGDDCLVAEEAARALASTQGRAYVSPYNDPLVVAGQGTLGLELEEQVPDLDAVFVALGGGGLIGGMGGALTAARDDLEVVACSPANSCVMHASLHAGRIVEAPSLPTLSDGTAGGVEPGSITFELCREVVGRSLLVEEDAIRRSLREVVARHRTLIEGAAAVAVAGFESVGPEYAGRTVAIVLCGANIAPQTLREVL
ncbi:MAG: threonine/serine dehydratase [Planctomycetota bacterium]|jgi:threonine dehydratase|nr:threonine/serine dehydratase [Planctomycetota bacterium]MDP6764215.1 threonine/serine dehydratase [Planctomycetota bacterium]MDP6988304.1 threonine/serine dehydratase [Planctomycetota bacterium]